jgi:hypothetical protein
MTNFKQKMWRLYYRLTLGAEESERRIQSAITLGIYLENQSADVGIGRNYDVQGNQIRGWHRRSYHPAPPQRNSHPLLDKYSR